MDRFSRARRVLIAGTFVVGMGAVTAPTLAFAEDTPPVATEEVPVAPGAESPAAPDGSPDSDPEVPGNGAGSVNDHAADSEDTHAAEDTHAGEAAHEGDGAHTSDNDGGAGVADGDEESSHHDSHEDGHHEADEHDHNHDGEHAAGESLVTGEVQMRINFELMGGADPDREMDAPVTAEDLAKLETLDLNGASAKDWSFLKYAVNLTSLKLGEIGSEEGHSHSHDDEHGTELDMAWLAGMTNLQYLDLTETELLNASELAKLTKLQHLDVSMTEGFDDSVLGSMPELTFLGIAGTGTSSLEGLAGAQNLESLEANNNDISDASPLAELTNLKHLNLSFNKISSADSLAKLTNLESLRLAQSVDAAQKDKITDISALTGMNKLTMLDLRNNALESTETFKDMKAPLEHLILSSNNILDNLEGLSGLTTLQSLEVARNPFIFNLNAIKDIPLVQLTVSEDGILNPADLEVHKDAFLISARDQKAYSSVPIEAGATFATVKLMYWDKLNYSLASTDPEITKYVRLEGNTLTVFSELHGKTVELNYSFSSESPRFELSGVLSLHVGVLPASENLDPELVEEDDPAADNGEGATADEESNEHNNDALTPETHDESVSDQASLDRSKVDEATQTEDTAHEGEGEETKEQSKKSLDKAQSGPAHARELPKTGDAGTLGMLLSGAFASLAGAAALRRRKH